MALRVQDTSPAVDSMACEWPIVEALLGGTRTMRTSGVRYLPKWPNEDQLAYDARVLTATLYPALKRTISVMGGKPFAKALTFGDDVPERIKEWCDDCDLEGRNLHTFASEMLQRVLGFGIAGVLVEYPVTRAPDGTQLVRTLADEAKTGVRPYLVPIKHSQILGWQTAKQPNGVTILTQLRLKECSQVADGEFGTKDVDRVRVLAPGKWTLFEKAADRDEYAPLAGPEGAGTTTLPIVPFVPFYGTRLGFMCGASPLLDLAYLNVKHWISQSDQDTILHVARVPILAVIGVDDDTFSLTVGASSAVKLPVGGDMKYVEHTGQAIGAGKISLDDLEQQMIQTGAELLVNKPGVKTATEANNDAEGNKSDLQRIVESFEDSLDQCLTLMGAWVGIPEDQTGHVSLFKDFGAATLTDASAQLILAMQAQGLITKKTAIIEQQRRGMLSPDIDPDEELAKAEAEGPPLGTLGGARLDQPIEPKPAAPPTPAPKPAPPAA